MAVNSPDRLTRSAIQQEEAIERSIYEDALAGDSEDEDETFEELPFEETVESAMQQLENLAVIGEESPLAGGSGGEQLRALYGAPAGWIPPVAPPEDWKAAEPKSGQPESFDEVDNPGQWSEFTYQPKFAKGNSGPYLYHCLPTGCTPVPAHSSDGKRVVRQRKVLLEDGLIQLQICLRPQAPMRSRWRALGRGLLHSTVVLTLFAANWPTIGPYSRQ